MTKSKLFYQSSNELFKIERSFSIPKGIIFACKKNYSHNGLCMQALVPLLTTVSFLFNIL